MLLDSLYLRDLERREIAEALILTRLGKMLPASHHRGSCMLLSHACTLDTVAESCHSASFCDGIACRSFLPLQLVPA